MNAPFHVGSRRWFLQAGASSSLLLPWSTQRGWTAESRSDSQPNPIESHLPGGVSKSDPRAVILFWLSGGPSHVDMWDPKPAAPSEVRGPFQSISTRVPGVAFCEHLPLQASLADRLTVIRSVDCSASDHTPITMQAGNPLARRTNDGRDGDGYPSMGSVAARFRGANHRDLPPFVGLADDWVSDVWEAGVMGRDYAPANGGRLTGRFELPRGVSLERLADRDRLRQAFNQAQQRWDRQAENWDELQSQARDMVMSGHVQRAFDLSREPDHLRDAYGRSSLGEKGLLARRLVEAGVTFVLVSGAWGYFDHHGDSVRWGGIEKGLTPLLPSVDRVLFTLIRDLESRGLLDTTLVMMMGEFGRAPRINSDGGRDHWTPVMSMVLAGGGLRHGQVIGATDRLGGEIQERPVRPQDLAATVFRHLNIPLDSHWVDPRGRPRPIVPEGGEPLAELWS